jgi:regulator of PEP synthase PpsR (kinase-PPPase family)
MKLFIISDDTRVTQETLFLNTISKFNNLDIVYCALAKRNDIDRGKYKNIELLDKNTIVKRLMLEK